MEKDPIDSESIGIPTERSETSWQDNFAIVCCFISFTIAVCIVFVQRWAVYWTETGQFVYIGLTLTFMTFCTQFFVRRLFLVLSLKVRPSSTLQSIDAVIRSDPFASKAHWSTRTLLLAMLLIPAGLSAAYKLLGGGDSSYVGSRTTQIGLTGPPGTQNIGYGLSLFVNATLPWFEQPGFARPYGFNTYVVNENVTAMLDGPMPKEVQAIQASLGDNKYMTLTGNVSALVCFLNPDLGFNRSNLDGAFISTGGIAPDGVYGESGQKWVWDTNWNLGMLLLNKTNSTSIYFSNWSTPQQLNFAINATHYEMIRQNYTATWLITPTTIRLQSAEPRENERLDEQGVFTNTRVSLVEMFLPAIVEYDTLYHTKAWPNSTSNAIYDKGIKSRSTTLAGAVWARFTAYRGPETWSNSSQNSIHPGLNDTQAATLLYSREMLTTVGAKTIKRDWRILTVLLANPLIMLAAYSTRVLLWPGSPIGNGFGVISLLASADKHSLRLLDGAGLSGVLRHPLPLVVDISEAPKQQQRNIPYGAQTPATGTIITRLGISYKPRAESLSRGTLYR